MLVIANADAGTAEGLAAAMEVLGGEPHRTSTQAELDALVRQDRFVVAAGGDGTLHAVVNALHRQGLLDRTVVALIPLGTGNDFARGAGIPLDPVAAAELVRYGSPRPVDLLVDDTGTAVVNSVHIGVGAEASLTARPWKRWIGPLAYPVGAVVAAARPATLRLRVTVDGEVAWDRPALQVAVGNAPYVGGGTELTPRADVSDGFANVLVSGAVGLGARLWYAVRLRRGEHDRDRHVVYRRARTVTVAGEPFHASADGELHGPLTRRTWSVREGALRMVVP